MAVKSLIVQAPGVYHQGWVLYPKRDHDILIKLLGVKAQLLTYDF